MGAFGRCGCLRQLEVCNLRIAVSRSLPYPSYPFHNLISPAIATLFTGSALVVKVSEQTAWSSQFFTNIIKGALLACGHSEDLIQTVACWPQTANYLTSNPSISHITFIGSREIGHKVAASAEKTLTPVCMELGGKDAAIILDDVSNLPQVASILLRGTFQSAGQNCIGIERIICQSTIYPRLVSLLESRIKLLRLGSALDTKDTVDVVAMISVARFSQLEHLISDAVKHGARLLAGGRRFVHPEYPKGHYFSPTLLVDVTTDMSIANEELFGPVCVVMRADSVSHAIDLANSTPFALGASVFGRNRCDLDRVTREVSAGMVAVNDFAVYYAVSLPFGGVRGSGYGRFGGEEGLRALCNTKAVCRDRWPGLVSTSIPPQIDYPIQDLARGWELVKGVVLVGYAEGWAWGKGLLKLLRNM